MKTIIKVVLLAFLMLPACKNADLSDQLEACQKELAAKNEAAIEKPDLKLIHTVYLNVKDDIAADDLELLLNGIRTLENIPGVFNLKSGTFKDLDDQRALAEYEVVFQMAFQNKATYRLYQQDSMHLAFKKSVAYLLAGPPATYDFVAE